ncbi:MAG: hypothetical protein JSS49_06390 [Planctomycetes bacterium]|nr:hypothetical protein [Planctomycetota bacterium]
MMIIGTLGKTGFVSAEEWRRPVLEVFVRGESERSQAAREFVKKNYGERPGVLLVIRDVTTSEKDLARFWKLADHFGHAKPQLPAFYVSGQFESGWDATTTPIRLEEALTIEVFTRQGCPRCAEAKPILFKTLAARYPGYRFVERDVAATESARKRLSELSQRYRVQATSVPAVHVCGRLMVGFTDTGTNLRQWDEVLRAVTIQAADGESAPEPTSSLQKTLRRPVGALHWFESVVHAGEPPIDQDRETTSPPSPPVIKDLSDDETIDRPKRGLPPETSDESEPSLIPATPGITAPEVVELPVLGSVRWRDWGFPAFTFAVGLIDGFNPCAMWVLLFLLSMLVNLRDRWKILAVAGTFVFISGAAYYAFMAAWLSIFEIVGFLRPAQITLGLIGITIGVINVKDFFAFKEGISLSIPESAKPGLYARIRRIVLAKSIGSAIAGASVVAVLVNIIELLCTAGLPAMYTSILNSQNLPWWQDHLYLLLYIIAYMFDDSLMVAGVVITLDKFKLQERGGRILKLISGVVVLALGLTMLLKPEWLV